MRSRWRLSSQGDEENQLQRVPIPSRNHPAGNLALCPVYPELSRRRRFIGGTRHYGLLRDRSALGEPFRADDRGGICANADPSPTRPGIWTKSISRSMAAWSIFRAPSMPRAKCSMCWSRRKGTRGRAETHAQELLKKYGFVPDKLVTDDLDPILPQPVILESQNAMNAVDGATIEQRTRTNRPDEGSARCKGSRAWDPREDFSQSTPRSTIPSTSNAISLRQKHTELSGHRRCKRGAMSSSPREPTCQQIY